MHGEVPAAGDGGPGRGDAHGPDSEAIEAFATSVANAAAVDSNLAVPPQRLRELLAEQCTALVDALRAPASASGHELGYRFGGELLEVNLNGPTALPTVLRSFQQRALELAGTEERELLTTICAGLAAGYVHASRERLLDEQESIKRSAVLANEAAERSRQRSEARFRAVFTRTGIGMALGDVRGRFVEVNPALCEIFGRTEPDLVGESVLEYIHPTDKRRLTDSYERLITGDIDSFSDEYQVMNAEGLPVWAHVTMTMMPESESGERYAIGTVENVTDLQLLRAEHNRTVGHDRQTGLPNVDQLNSRLRDLVDEASPGEQVALCFFDIDGFKVINDGLGRDVGDKMLLSLATHLRARFGRPGNLIARVAGDGFAALIQNPESQPWLIREIQQLQQLVSEPYFVDKRQDGVALSLSIGIAMKEAATIAPDELVRAAEITLHRAKAKGKAQWMFHDAEEDVADRKRYHLGAVIPGALESGEFSVSYEPVRALADSGLHGYVASLRWWRRETGYLTPPEFMPLAEETGMILALDKWLVSEVTKHIAHWRNEFDKPVPDIGVSLSARTTRDQELVGIVREPLRESKVPEDALTLHLPVHELADEDVAGGVSDLGSVGLRIAAAGCGGGPILFDLTELPISEVRLTTDAAENATVPSVLEGLRAFITMAHAEDRLVSASGVRTEEQLAALRSVGVDLASGPAVGPALAPAQVAASLE